MTDYEGTTGEHIEWAEASAPHTMPHSLGGTREDASTSIAHSLIAIAKALSPPETLARGGLIAIAKALNPAVRILDEEDPDAIHHAAFLLLKELVQLKDGPRDEEYQRRKLGVWQRARDLVGYSG